MSAIDASGEFYGFRPVVPFTESFDGVLGLELLDGELGDGQRVRARVAVRDELLTARGTLHGGVLAESPRRSPHAGRRWRSSPWG